MLMCTNMPLGSCSLSLLDRFSAGDTRDTKDELVLTMLFFGFFFFNASFPSLALICDSAGLSCPNTGDLNGSSISLNGLDVAVVLWTLLALIRSAWLPASTDGRDNSLVGVSVRDSFGKAADLGARHAKEILEPAEGGFRVVSRGFWGCVDASEGCGGGVARSMLSRSWYVPNDVSAGLELCSTHPLQRSAGIPPPLIARRR
jgi:hypothetical protein